MEEVDPCLGGACKVGRDDRRRSVCEEREEKVDVRNPAYKSLSACLLLACWLFPRRRRQQQHQLLFWMIRSVAAVFLMVIVSSRPVSLMDRNPGGCDLLSLIWLEDLPDCPSFPASDPALLALRCFHPSLKHVLFLLRYLLSSKARRGVQSKKEKNDKTTGWLGTMAQSGFIRE